MCPRSEAREIEHLRHAEVKIAARLLPRIRVGERRDRLVFAPRRQTGGDADVHMRIHEPRRQVPGAPVDTSLLCTFADGDLCETSTMRSPRITTCRPGSGCACSG